MVRRPRHDFRLHDHAAVTAHRALPLRRRTSIKTPDETPDSAMFTRPRRGLLAVIPRPVRTDPNASLGCRWTVDKGNQRHDRAEFLFFIRPECEPALHHPGHATADHRSFGRALPRGQPARASDDFRVWFRGDRRFKGTAWEFRRRCGNPTSESLPLTLYYYHYIIITTPRRVAERRATEPRTSAGLVRAIMAHQGYAADALDRKAGAG